MNPPQQPRHERAEPIVDTARPIAISHIVHTLRSYAPAIALTVLGVTLFYTIVALAYYLTGPTERVTTLPFRLDFEGADVGTYPNGMKFSPAEIVNSQVLLRVFNSNKLDRFVTFAEFSRALFVLESNETLERLQTEYQSRLSDPKLTSVERERIQKEFDLKRASVAKNEYAISYARTVGGDLPEQLTRKVLGDILATWAEFAAKEQHVLKYDVAILSPRFMDPTPIEQTDPVIAVQILRMKTLRVFDNIADLLSLPAARLARTKTDGVTLVEVRGRVDEIMRFRLEPLVPLAVRSGALSNPAATITFVETQLAHDQRVLEAQKARAEGFRNAIVMYFSNQPGNAAAAEAAGREGTAPPTGVGSDRAPVTPQLSESFIDRLMSLTSNAADVDYRQKTIDQYRQTAEGVIPLQEAVQYDLDVLEALRGASAGARGNDAALQAQIASIRADMRSLIGTINQLHEVVSANLNPTTDLFTTMSPPYTRVHRTRSLPRLLLVGVIVVLATLLAAILGALLHRRVREEEAEEGYTEESAQQAV